MAREGGFAINCGLDESYDMRWRLSTKNIGEDKVSRQVAIVFVA